MDYEKPLVLGVGDSWGRGLEDQALSLALQDPIRQLSAARLENLFIPTLPDLGEPAAGKEEVGTEAGHQASLIKSTWA